jgi:phospholipase A-2-activating protein
VQFIIQNTGAAAGPRPGADLPITGGFCDPFTGGGDGGGGGGGGGGPPRPQPPPPAATFSVTGGGVDPFTGGGSGGGVPPPAGPRAGALPLAYLLFDAPPPAEGLRKKLLEFSGALAAAPELAHLALSPEEAAPGGVRG